MNPDAQETETVRIDKWLWAVRLFKTRSLATEACRSGHVKVDGHNVKPARNIHVGELVVAKTGDIHRTVKVTGLLERRVSAKQAEGYLEDLTPAEEREKVRERVLGAPVVRPKGAGRPTKKDRRALDQLEF